MGWCTTAFLKSLGKIPPVKQLIFLFKKSTMRLGNCFVIFVGISLSWVALFYVKSFNFWQDNYLKCQIWTGRQQLPCEHLIPFFSNSATRTFLVFCISFFNWVRNVRGVLQIYCWLPLIPRFETMFIKKLFKTFAILYLFLINWSFSLRIMDIYSHFTRTCAYQGVRNVRFSENLASFVFLKHLFWDSSFRLITDKLHVYFFACYKSI